MYHSNVTCALRQTYLQKGFNLTWQELTLSILNDLCSYADILVQVICSQLAGTEYTIPFFQLYLFKGFDHTCQELNVSFHSDLCSTADMPVQVILSHLVGNRFIIPLWPMLLGRHTCRMDLITLFRTKCIVAFFQCSQTDILVQVI